MSELSELLIGVSVEGVYDSGDSTDVAESQGSWPKDYNIREHEQE